MPRVQSVFRYVDAIPRDTGLSPDKLGYLIAVRARKVFAQILPETAAGIHRGKHTYQLACLGYDGRTYVSVRHVQQYAIERLIYADNIRVCHV